MKTVVYLDVLIIINLILDYFILLCVKLITSDQTRRLRLFFGAICAAISSLVILAPPLNGFVLFIYKVVTAIIIITLAFKWQGKKNAVKKFLWYIFFNICLAGFVILYRIGIDSNLIESNNLEIYLDISPIVLMLSIMSIYLFLKTTTFLFGSPLKDTIHKFLITVNGIDFTVETFWDTGFMLTDYLTQSPVIMVNYCQVRDTELKKLLVDYYENKNIVQNEKYKLRVLMIKTANSESLAPCITAQKITLCSKNISIQKLTVVFTNTMLDNSYSALAGTQFMNCFGF